MCATCRNVRLILSRINRYIAYNTSGPSHRTLLVFGHQLIQLFSVSYVFNPLDWCKSTRDNDCWFDRIPSTRISFLSDGLLRNGYRRANGIESLFKCEYGLAQLSCEEINRLRSRGFDWLIPVPSGSFFSSTKHMSLLFVKIFCCFCWFKIYAWEDQLSFIAFLPL